MFLLRALFPVRCSLFQIDWSKRETVLGIQRSKDGYSLPLHIPSQLTIHTDKDMSPMQCASIVVEQYFAASLLASDETNANRLKSCLENKVQPADRIPLRRIFGLAEQLEIAPSLPLSYSITTKSWTCFNIQLTEAGQNNDLSSSWPWRVIDRIMNDKKTDNGKSANKTNEKHKSQTFLSSFVKL